MKKLLFALGILLALVIPAVVVGVVLNVTDPEKQKPPEPVEPEVILSAREQLEARLKKFNKLLLQADYAAPKDAAAQSMVFDAEALKTHELYFKDLKSKDRFVFIDSLGILRDSNESGEAMRLKRSGEILVNTEGTWLFLDGVPYGQNLRGWTCYWVATKAAKPALTEHTFARREMDDSFMRTTLTGDNAPWIATSGSWSMKKHGGGIPTTEEQMANYSFQRAVNPFSIMGKGVLTYGKDVWQDGHAEARFYFGKPWEAGAVDTQSVPVQTDMLVAFGQANGRMVAFGWRGRERNFVLVQRDKSQGKWKELAHWKGLRPPVSNWVRIGLQIRNGCVAEGYLDGEKILSKELSQLVRGPFHIVGGDEAIEFDDVRAWTLPLPESKGTPIFAKSRNFAGKRLKGNSDPSQFSEWAKSAGMFVKMIERTAEYKRAMIVNRLPLMGDFFYETVPEDPEVGELPFGLYEVAFYQPKGAGELSLSSMKEIVRMQLIRDEDGWLAAGEQLSGVEMNDPQFTLRIRRKATERNDIALQVGKEWVPIAKGHRGPVHIAVTRLLPLESRAVFPEPQHHNVFSSNFSNEFFESSPTEWNWIEGGFRMDCRWACQDQWNFMACGGVGVPMMVSKNSYHGDQAHEYFLSLRPMFPSDAGDPDFVYTQAEHRRYFNVNLGWYVRRDLNFSFCTDGRNPMSGYSVVFGGKDNTETRLLRLGKIVARTTSYKLPISRSVGTVHWKWWNFRVRRTNGHVQVYLNKNLLFNYKDPDPLDGGHVAFWTVRSGFTLSRVTSVGERVRRNAQVLYVENDTAPAIWTPVQRDAVRLTRQNGPIHTQVTANVGTGFFAIRHRPPQAVDLRKTPIMEIPIEVPSDVKVNIHLQVDDSAYVIQLTAPLGETKAILAPEFEKTISQFGPGMSQYILQKVEQFRIPTMSEYTMKSTRLLATAIGGDMVRVNLVDLLKNRAHTGNFKLTCVTVGNSSNADYLLAGNGANAAGATYNVGTPKFKADK